MSEIMNGVSVLTPMRIDSKSINDLTMKLRNWAEDKIDDVFKANEKIENIYGATMNLNKGPHATEAWNTYCQNQGMMRDLKELIKYIDKVNNYE